MQAQRPNPASNSKKATNLLAELERTKLEGDPLSLYGNTTDPSLDTGDHPSPPGEALTTGYRLILYGGRQDDQRTAIGVHSTGGFWVQVPNLTEEDLPIFDIYQGGDTVIFRCVHRALTDILLFPMFSVGIDDVFNDNATSVLHVHGPISIDIDELTSGQDLQDNKGVYLCDATGAAFTVTLPDNGIVQGRIYMVKRMNGGANAVTVDVDGGGTIDGAASKSLNSQYAVLGVIAGPDEWQVLWTFGTVA